MDMSDCISRSIYLKQLYFNVGKTILSRNYNIFLKQIDYIYAEKTYFELLERVKTEKNILFMDKNGAFFNLLATKLLSNSFKSLDAVYTLSPFYSENVINSLFIPSENLSIINQTRYDSKIYCPGYLVAENPHILYNTTVAKEFFDKAEKI